MESQIVYLSDLNFNLDVWKRELKFQESEMDYFEEKLEHVAIRNLGVDVMIKLEAFQNKIIREREVMGHLRHRIRMKKRELAQAKFEPKPEVLYHEKQIMLKDEMKTFVQMHYDLKEDMMDFFLKYL
jgi:predicted  nucleic acid-binding Zn-ribbon protein